MSGQVSFSVPPFIWVSFAPLVGAFAVRVLHVLQRRRVLSFQDFRALWGPCVAWGRACGGHALRGTHSHFRAYCGCHTQHSGRSRWAAVAVVWSAPLCGPQDTDPFGNLALAPSPPVSATACEPEPSVHANICTSLLQMMKTMQTPAVVTVWHSSPQSCLVCEPSKSPHLCTIASPRNRQPGPHKACITASPRKYLVPATCSLRHGVA